MLIHPELYKSRIRLTALSLILFFSQPVFPQSSPLIFKGGVDTHVYKTDTVLFEAAVLDDDSPTLTSGSFSTGLTMLHSPYISMFYVPVKYGINDFFQISLSVPYLTKTLVVNDNHYIKNGFGDTSLGLTAFIEPSGFFTASAAARMTIPTGDADSVESGVYIPMGSGGYTASLQQSISIGYFDTGFFRIRFFAHCTGIRYFSSKQEIGTGTEQIFDKSYAWSAAGGIDLGLTDKFNFELKLNYISIKERKYKIETDPSSPGEWTDADDSVRQTNIVPLVKYRFFDDLHGRFGFIYPLKTVQDDDLTMTCDPQWKIVVSIEKNFGDNPYSKKLSGKAQ